MSRGYNSGYDSYYGQGGGDYGYEGYGSGGGYGGDGYYEDGYGGAQGQGGYGRGGYGGPPHAYGASDPYQQQRYQPPSRPTFSTKDGSCVSLAIPSQFVGMIIGRSGAKIKELEKESEARIKIADRDPQDPEACVDMVGPFEKQMKAKRLIEELLTSSDDGKRRFGRPYKPKDGITVKIPTQLIGKVIGKGGTMIKKLQDDNNCKIKIRGSKFDGTVESPVDIVASPENEDPDAAILKVKNELDDLIREGQQSQRN